MTPFLIDLAIAAIWIAQAVFRRRNDRRDRVDAVRRRLTRSPAADAIDIIFCQPADIVDKTGYTLRSGSYPSFPANRVIR